MSKVTFPNTGQEFVSSALTPAAFETLFQPLVALMLGLDPEDSASNAFGVVRLAWQQEGQPAPAIDKDSCTLRATLENEPFSRVRDGLYQTNDAVSLTQRMAYTQVWNLHATLYGANAAANARLLFSVMDLDWVHDTLAASNLYAIRGWEPPKLVPENFSGRWWPRADFDVRFNELVNESLTVPSAAGVDITLIKDTGLTAEIHLRVPAGGN